MAAGAAATAPTGRRAVGCGCCLVVVLVGSMLTTLVHQVDGVDSRKGVLANLTLARDLNHMVVDGTGHVYLGAVNALYKVSPDLSRLIQTVRTGPVSDNEYCLAHNFNDSSLMCDNYPKVMTDNHNKVLVVDMDNALLLTCGSIHQGTCQFRQLTDINNAIEYNQIREQYLAANDATSSTVAFIAPGPPDPKRTKVLYKATTFTGSSQVRRDVPIIGIYKLSGGRMEALTYVHEDALDQTGSYLRMKQGFYNYNITYVAGFNVGKFNYFLSVQQRLMGGGMQRGPFYTKIIRMCDNDRELVSYVEMPLECGKYNLLQSASVSSPGQTLATQMGITTNDKILVAAFAESESESSSAPKNPHSTGICVYSFKQINERFVQNIQDCFGSASMGTSLLKYVRTIEDSCISSQSMRINDSFCGLVGMQDPINTLIDGGISMSATTVIKYGTLITAIAVSRIEEHTIAFLGTTDGKLKKLVVQKDGAGMSEYDELSIKPGHAVLRDMKFDPDKKHLYVMTKNNVFKVKVSNCDRHTNCRDCALVSLDPYCGWCSLERRCTQKSLCRDSNQSNYWLSQKSWGCVQITTVKPDRASLSHQVQVKLTVDQLPLGSRNDYVCMFDDVEVMVDAVDTVGIMCTTPPSASALPPIREDQDHVNVTLGIKSIKTGMVFVEKSFSFYNCSMHASCTMCTMAKWGCNWCVYDNKCISSMESCSSSRRPVAFTQHCPQLLIPDNRILVPVGVRWEIELQGRNLPRPLAGQSGYKCVFHHRSPPVMVDARLVTNSTVVCDAKEYTYIPRESEKMAKVDVVWNNNFYIDDENDVQITFYKCDVMGEDCSLCMSLATTKPAYKCRWCGNNGCTYDRACTAGQASAGSCPKPKIHGVTPLTGPLKGNTPVTITGSNLGTTFQQIDRGVTVAGKPCLPDSSKYKVAREIVCVTTAVPAATSGPVIVKVGQANTTWMSNFMYQDPVLESIRPKIGPIAGGTEVTITGKALNTGVEIRVMLDSLPCTYNQEPSATMLTCLTSRVALPRTTGTVKVYFDGSPKKLTTGATFNYTNNPNITNIYPTSSYISGGRTLTVEGRLFDIIQRPKIFLISGMLNSSEENCQKVNDTQILCPTPNVKDFLQTSRRRRQATEYQLRVGFKMDGVTEVTDLAAFMPWVDSTIRVYPNPMLQKFPQGKFIYSGGALVLKGDGLTLASTMSEIRVNVGNKECEIETLSDTKIVCRPPSKKPSAQDPPPEVVVAIGNEQYQLGTLEYQSQMTSTGLSQTVTIIISIAGSILVLIIIIILIIYRRKSTAAERQFKKMQLQLDTLESNVRNECKQAFAELQTEVTDLTSDLNVTGIPFWDYKTYTFKVLFPSHTDHPVLHNKLDFLWKPSDDYLQQMHNSTMKRPAGQELGLQQFNQLLNSRQFLITFIRTLEEQRNFSIRDKAVVASLLMIVLQDKMEYATEILKALLNELIDRSVEKKHPKLMLRRTESVVEKFLTNWLSICMYSYLKKHAGKSMFLLYKAIKHQTEKGPVDAITSEARYSLSEDRLLREKIEPKTLTINLVVEHEAEMVTCKVLDCDTITQAKEKCLDAIYMNTPCSRRPAVYDVDLEWRSGRSGHLPLQDEDVTTQMVHGWKRINTLAHYHVPDGAIMSIAPTRNKNDMIRHQHGMVEITPGSPFSGIKPIVTVEEGHKVWHLVKHDDPHNQSRTQKVISEIFLTRLLSTKGTLQQFIDDLFLMILKVDNSVPPAIKYLFDFLDQAARRHNIVDSEVVHTWKSNSLPLRFWVNLIKNPEFVFDIRKSNIVDSCLSVIAQTFMDSCSTSEHRLGKDSPSNKLLFARDIPKYRKWVEKFYKDVAEMPPVTEPEMNEAMIELSTQNIVDFNVPCALKELYRYALQYNVELLEALDEDSSARKLHLANKFEQVVAVMDGTPLY